MIFFICINRPKCDVKSNIAKAIIDVKTYGYDIIMRPLVDDIVMRHLVDDIKELETNGVHIDSDVFNGTEHCPGFR